MTSDLPIKDRLIFDVLRHGASETYDEAEMKTDKSGFRSTVPRREHGQLSTREKDRKDKFVFNNIHLSLPIMR